MFFVDWYSITSNALETFFRGVILFIPKMIGALIVFCLGILISNFLGKLISKVLEKVNFNKLLEKSSWRNVFERAKVSLEPALFLGELARWVLLIVFLLASVEILGFSQFAGFITNILGFIGNAIVASLMFLVTMIAVDFVSKFVIAAGEGMKFSHSRIIGEITRWGLWIFACLAIMHQLGIAQSLVEIITTGIVAVLVIAFGIAFGLGGKEIAGDILSDLRRKLKG